MAIMSSGPPCAGMTASLSDAATQTFAVRAPPSQLHPTFQTYTVPAEEA
jgi:hypothetical protein